MTFIKAADQLIPLAAIERVDMTGVEQGYIDVVYQGQILRAEGFDAFDAVMLLKPAALEGRKLRWPKHAWAVHNLIAHPVMQMLVWMGFRRLAMRVHDETVPYPSGIRAA